VFDADHVRLGRIAGKLAAARAMPVPPQAFGVEAHGYKLGAPLPEAVVAEFEERHEVALPPAYRLFVTELGDGGAGPGYSLTRLSASCDTRCQPGHLLRPSPYLPGPRYFGDWEERHEEPPGPDGMYLPGTLEVAGHGCSLYTRLVVTGPARGRLFNLDCGGSLGPYVVEDADFLAWYERWLDEAVAGYDVGWFGERLPLDEPGLIAVLARDPSPARRARAGESLLQLPAISDSAWTVLSVAMTADVNATVRATARGLLRSRRHERQPRLDDAGAIAGEIALHARACTPPDLEALDMLRKLTLADVLAELAAHDLERRRRAAYRLGWRAWAFAKTAPQGLLDDVAGRLLSDTDPLLRLHGVAVVRWFRPARLYPLLRELQKTETDPWVQHHLGWCLSEQPLPEDDFFAPAALEGTEQPPF
jgi:hypothetical protein